MFLFACIAAIISYLDGLELVRLAGASGHVAYLYPLLPDGLIVISFISLYDAGRAGISRPRWAVAGVATGAVLTLAMNVSAGASHSWLYALVDGAVPVVFYVAFENFTGLLRRGRGGPDPSAAPATSAPAAATPGQPPAVWLDEQIRALRSRMSERATAESLGVTRARVARATKPPAALAPAASVNGHAPEVGAGA